MSKRGLSLGTWKNAHGNNYVGLGGSTGGVETRRQSTKGYYHVAFVKEYRDLTERDFELKLDYGKDLVHHHTKVPLDMLALRKKSEHQTLSAVDSVYYVRRGKDIIGKLSIRAQRRFSELTLVYVYSTKDYAPKQLRGNSFKRAKGTLTKSDKRKSARKKKPNKARD